MTKLLSSIDIGSNNIICLISTVNNDGRLCLKSASFYESEGIKDGDIVDIELAKKSILKAILRAEQIINKNIDTIVINISGNFLKSKTINKSSNILNPKKIAKKDICLLAKMLSDDLKTSNKTPIHIIPISSFINNNVVDNPIGIVGNNLSVNFHTMYLDNTKLYNIKNCFKKINLKIDNFIFEGYASALGVLNDYEKNAGSLVINIGASLTSFSIIKEDKFIYGNSIQMAGDCITKDIADVLDVSISIAEKAKVLNANFYLDNVEENEIIKIDINNEDSFKIASTKKSLINNIIKARIDDIINIILDIVDKKNLKHMFSNIVLTGGSSNILGLDNYITKTTGIKSRIGYASGFYTAPCLNEKQISGPSYSTAIGLLVFSNLFYKENKIDDYKSNNNIFNKVINFLINLFIS